MINDWNSGIKQIVMFQIPAISDGLEHNTSGVKRGATVFDTEE